MSSVTLSIRDPQAVEALALSDEFVVRNTTVITMDAQSGDHTASDLRVRAGRIVDIVPTGQGSEAGVVIDGTGAIVLPGFHDTHRHCWQGVMRRLIPNVDDNAAYIHTAHEILAPLYTADDVYQGTRLSGLGALNNGITTLMDFSHNTRSDAHADAAVHGLADTGIRAVHANSSPVVGEWANYWPASLARLQSTVDGLPHDRVTLRLGALAVESIGGPNMHFSERLIRHARDLGLGVSVDAVLGAEASQVVSSLGRSGLLGPDILLIHCSDLSSEAWAAIRDSGTRIALAATSDASIGIASSIPPIQDALDNRVEPSLSVDVEIALSGDMLTQMRTVLNTQRMMAFHRRYMNAGGAIHDFGDDDHESGISARDVLRYATTNGADAVGLAQTTGRLSSGYAADFLIVDAMSVNNFPLNNAMGTIVNGSDSADIVGVFVDGIPRKWAGRLVGVDLAEVSAEVEKSRDDLLARAGMTLDPLAN